jgi:hypothetical protein
MSRGAAGGSTLASAALHGVAFADGARPIAAMNATAAADATASEALRKIADM